MQTVIVVALIALGGALPLLGLGRLALRAHKALPGEDRVSATELVEEGAVTGLVSMDPLRLAAQMVDAVPVLEWARIRWDLGFVGGGIVCGTIGSIWAVFL